MRFSSYFLILLLKLVISDRDVTNVLVVAHMDGCR